MRLNKTIIDRVLFPDRSPCGMVIKGISLWMNNAQNSFYMWPITSQFWYQHANTKYHCNTSCQNHPFIPYIFAYFLFFHSDTPCPLQSLDLSQTVHSYR